MKNIHRPSHFRRALSALTATALTAAVTVAPAQACTSFLLGTSDGAFVYGRTMEFGFELKSDGVVIPRGYGFSSPGSNGKPGMSWKTKYAATGLNGFGLNVLIDGMNEKGLAGGILYFPGYAEYADPAKADPAKSMAPWEFLTWALTNFATVAEVKAHLDGISVVGVKLDTLGFVPPAHYTLHDASGASIVIEPVGGVLKVYDNPLGVMTNSPTFDWHLTNLKNYVKLSPVNAPPLKANGQTISSFGEGSGLLGIPGDPTPPSRFIRALGYVLSAEPKPSGVESVRLAEHILNNFDLPIGFVRAGEKPTPDGYDYTQWSTVADMKNMRYYVKTYDDQVLRGIDLMSFDLDAKTVVNAPLKPDMTPPALSFSKP